MSIIVFDPTRLVDEIRNADDKPEVKLTGVLDIPPVELLKMVIQTLDSSAIVYGHQADAHNVYMATDSVEDYVEELICTIEDTTGIEEIQLEDEHIVHEDDDALSKEYRAALREDLGEVSDDLDDLDDEDDADTDELLEAHDILSDHIFESLKEVLKVVTGDHYCVKHNVMRITD